MKKFFFFAVIIMTLYLLSCDDNSTNPDSEYGIIDGIVMDDSLNPIENVELYTQPPTEVILSQSTGKFIFKKVPEGDYKIFAKKKAYHTKSIDVSVLKGKTSKATIILSSDGTLINDPPNKPSLVYPSNNSKKSGSIEFKWTCTDPEGDKLHYSFYLGIDQNNLELIGDNIEATSYQLDNFTNGTKYYWKIVAYDIESNNNSSDIWAFTIDNSYDSSILLNIDFNGSIVDLSNYGGTISNNRVTLTTDRYGNTNSAAYFDGASHLEVVNPSYMDFSQPFTVCAWIKVNQVNYNNTYEGEMDIVSRVRGAEYYTSSFALYLKYGLLKALIYRHNYGDTFLESSTTIKDNIWTHVAFVYDGNQLLLYENAKLVAIRNTGQPDKSNLNLFIGRRTQGNRYFTGHIDDILVVSKALSESAISDIYND